MTEKNMSNEPMEWHLSSEVFEENAMLAAAISEHAERLIAEQAGHERRCECEHTTEYEADGD